MQLLCVYQYGIYVEYGMCCCGVVIYLGGECVQIVEFLFVVQFVDEFYCYVLVVKVFFEIEQMYFRQWFGYFVDGGLNVEVGYVGLGVFVIVQVYVYCEDVVDWVDLFVQVDVGGGIVQCVVELVVVFYFVFDYEWLIEQGCGCGKIVGCQQFVYLGG